MRQAINELLFLKAREFTNDRLCIAETSMVPLGAIGKGHYLEPFEVKPHLVPNNVSFLLHVRHSHCSLTTGTILPNIAQEGM